MIILKDLEWSHCFRYGANNILHLDQDILTQVLGLNGIGKSSIPLILEEVLFNKNSKPVKKIAIPNRIHKGGYSISLTFEKEDDDYKIVVNRKNSIKVTLFKNNEDISSHTATNTYKTIQEILGVDFKTFSQLVYLCLSVECCLPHNGRHKTTLTF
jgi:DNA repair exonuclease SbcCD ATPase subunit